MGGRPRQPCALFVEELTGAQKKKISSSRAADQKAIDKALLANIKKVDLLAGYLASSFSPAQWRQAPRDEVVDGLLGEGWFHGSTTWVRGMVWLGLAPIASGR